MKPDESLPEIGFDYMAFVENLAYQNRIAGELENEGVVKIGHYAVLESSPLPIDEIVFSVEDDKRDNAATEVNTLCHSIELLYLGREQKSVRYAESEFVVQSTGAADIFGLEAEQYARRIMENIIGMLSADPPQLERSPN